MGKLFDLYGDPLDGSQDAGGAQPSAAGPSSPEEESSSLYMLDLGIQGALCVLRSWIFIPLCAVLIGGGGAYVVQQKVEPDYSAGASLVVDPILPRLLYLTDEYHKSSTTGFYNDWMRTLVNQLDGQAVMQRAVDYLAEWEVEWAAPQVPPEALRFHLAGRVDVAQMRETFLVNLTTTGKNAAALAPMINAVVMGAQDEFAERVNLRREEDTAQLELDHARLEDELGILNASLDDLSGVLGSAMISERDNLPYQRLLKLQEGLTKIFVERVRVEGAYQNALEAARELLENMPESEVTRGVELDQSVVDARVTFGRLQRELDEGTGHLSEEHPVRKADLARLATARERVVVIEEATRERIRAMIRAEREEEARTIVAAARREVTAAQQSEARMQQVMEAARAELAEHGRAMFEGRSLRLSADRIAGQMQHIQTRLEELRVEGNAPSRIRVESWAQEPGEPSGDKSTLLMAAAVLFGLGVGTVVALLVSLLRMRIKTRRDLERTGFQVLAEPSAAEEAAWPSELLLQLELELGERARRLVFAPVDRRVLPLAVLHVAGVLREQVTRSGRAGAPARCLVLDGCADYDEHDPSELRPWSVDGGLHLPLAQGAERLGRSLASGAFRDRLAELDQACEWTALALPALPADAAARVLGEAEFSAVLFARKKKSSVWALALAAKRIRAAGGQLAGVVLLDKHALRQPPAPPQVRPLPKERRKAS